LPELHSALGIASEEEFHKSLGMNIEQTFAGGDDKETVEAPGGEDKVTVGGGHKPAASLPPATAKGGEKSATVNEVKVSRKGIGNRHLEHQFSKVSSIVVGVYKYTRSQTFGERIQG
jgi:hypothetical protein